MTEGPTRSSVLVVDDTIENLQLLSRMLETQGYDVRPVTTGRHALQAAMSDPPDLVLLDVSMPEMDGFEVCRRFKQTPTLCEIPVIFLTALSETDHKLKAFEVGGADYITKPFQVEEVLARVHVHTGLQKARGELVRSYQRLKALERLREDLVQMVVHDMRSPLMGLMGLLDLMKEQLDGASSERFLEDLTAAVHAADSINRMANTVLDVSRLEEGKLPLDRQPHDLVALCRETVARLAPVDRTRSIELAGAAALEAVCDGELVGRVLENLVSNAIKHTPPGSGIRVTTAGDASHVRVAVEDHGPGVAPEARSKIFDKFAAVELRTQHAFHSAGLGLAFCKLAVEAHGGSIGLDCAKDHGSVFWFALPR